MPRTKSADFAGPRRPPHRPRIGGEDDPLLAGDTIQFPVRVLDEVAEYLLAQPSSEGKPKTTSRVVGIRELIWDALHEYNRPGRAEGSFAFERMPPELKEQTHRILLKLTKSQFDAVEDYRFAARLPQRTMAIQDLLWNGLRLWKRKPAARGRQTQPKDAE